MGYDMYWKLPPSETLKARIARTHDEFNAAVQERDAIPKEERGSFSAGDDYERAPSNASGRYKLAQDKVNEAYVAMQRAEVNYFRLNIWGMQRYRGLLEDLGIGYWPDTEHAEWPSNPFVGGILEDYWAWNSEEWDAEELAAYEAEHPDRIVAFRAHADLVAAHLAWVPPEATEKVDVDGEPTVRWRGINLEKFGSNDGWHVLPEECNSALRIIRDTPHERLEEAFRRHWGEDVDLNAVRDYWQEWVHFLIGAEHHGGFEVN